jgi:hypothetical protein
MSADLGPPPAPDSAEPNLFLIEEWRVTNEHWFTECACPAGGPSHSVLRTAEGALMCTAPRSVPSAGKYVCAEARARARGGTELPTRRYRRSSGAV